MQVKFSHPSKVELDEVVSLAEDGQVRTTPHVGNLDQENNPGYLALAMLGVELELVDTISSNDRHGNPQYLVREGSITRVASGGRKKLKNLFPSGYMIFGDNPTVFDTGRPKTFQETQEEEEALRVLTEVFDGRVSLTGNSLADVHLAPLETTGIKFILSSRFPESVSSGLSHVIAQAIYDLYPNYRLRVSNEGYFSQDETKRVAPSPKMVEELGVYGLKDVSGELSGIVLPVEAFTVTEIVGSALVSGPDAINHIGGSDMVVYTRSPQTQAMLEAVAGRTLDILGVPHEGSKVEYRVIDKNKGISGLAEESKSLADAIGVGNNFSQHDLPKLQTV